MTWGTAEATICPSGRCKMSRRLKDTTFLDPPTAAGGGCSGIGGGIRLKLSADASLKKVRRGPAWLGFEIGTPALPVLVAGAVGSRTRTKPVFPTLERFVLSPPREESVPLELDGPPDDSMSLSKSDPARPMSAFSLTSLGDAQEVCDAGSDERPKSSAPTTLGGFWAMTSAKVETEELCLPYFLCLSHLRSGMRVGMQAQMMPSSTSNSRQAQLVMPP